MKQHNIDDRMRIRYHPKNQPVQQVLVRIIATIAGGDLVAVDTQGRVYTTYWETNAEQAGHPKIGKRHWRCYKTGLFYLHRGLVAAMITAEEFKIPTLEALQAFCQDQQAEISILSGKQDLAQLQIISRQFGQLHDFLKGKIRWPLTESRDQLSFFLLLRDRLGRVNVGVLQARLSTINRRFTTELAHLLGWLPHYAARQQAIGGLLRHLQRQVAGIERALTAMAKHKGLSQGQTDATQITGLNAALGRHITTIEALQEIQPFAQWAQFCLDDLKKAQSALSQARFADARQLIARLTYSSRLRYLGFALEEVIAGLSVDLLLGRPERDAYWQKLFDLATQFREIKDDDFAQAIVSELVGLVDAARIEVPNWPKVKQLLKQAANLI